MKTVIETFVYEIPDNCNEFLKIQDYVEFADQMTCPFYDGMNNIPEKVKHCLNII